MTKLVFCLMYWHNTESLLIKAAERLSAAFIIDNKKSSLPVETLRRENNEAKFWNVTLFLAERFKSKIRAVDFAQEFLDD